MTPGRPSRQRYDAIVIGGGFFGCTIGVYLVRRRGKKHVLLVERSETLLARASTSNQARVHNGYHYPRSYTTAYRSRLNLPLFRREWPTSVKSDFTKIYAIARQNSKVTAQQFQRFCANIGATLEPVPQSLRLLFDRYFIEDVFIAQEFAFDARELARLAARDLEASGVEVLTGTEATDISGSCPGAIDVRLSTAGHESHAVTATTVLNCTYAGLNRLASFPRTRTSLKHEIAEMALIEMPDALRGLGITVMDGPFFSAMPFPPRGLHTLSHLRYTPHRHWIDRADIDPYQVLTDYPRESRGSRMVRDAARYLPAIADARQIDSLFEVKTILVKNEGDDGRPILFERHHSLPGAYSILGGKLDNIFDVLDTLDSEAL